MRDLKNSKKTSPPTELEIVESLRRRFFSSAAVKLGPGDDAAVLAWPHSAPDMVVSTDMLTEGVDFLLERVTPQKIARKALAVNASDLAAMAAEPVACVISVAMPKNPRIFPGERDRWLRYRDETPQTVTPAVLMEKLAEGFQEIAEEFQMPIVGGDTNTWDGGLVISVTVIGKTRRVMAAGNEAKRSDRIAPPSDSPLLSGHSASATFPAASDTFLRRSGAKPGDIILVTGSLGGSILRRQFTFTPRVREMLLLAQKYPLHAGMDISDGLSLDLWRLTRESGCGAILDPRKIPISADARELSSLDIAGSRTYDWVPPTLAAQTPLQHALTDGEDFEILFTASPEITALILKENPLTIPITPIGEILPEPGLWLRTHTGGRKPLKPKGFTHE